MADSKNTALSIEIRAVDRATAVVRAINAKIASVANRGMNVAKGMASEIGSVISSIGSVLGGVLDKIPLIGGVIAGAIGGAVAAVVHLVDKFDNLGKAAERVGVGVDFLADLRYAAEKTGAPIEALDEGLQTFSQNLGQARAGTGRMVKFLSLVSPALLQQLKAAKSNEAAFLLLADAMAKLQDPAKRAALAQKTVGDAALAPLLARGAIGVKKLAAEHEDLAGSMKDAVAASEEAKASMVELHAAVDGAEAAIVVGMAPALKLIVEQLSEWFVTHRADITEWAKTIGEKIPGVFKGIVDWVGKAIEALGKFFGVLGDIYDKVKEIAGFFDDYVSSSRGSKEEQAYLEKYGMHRDTGHGETQEGKQERDYEQHLERQGGVLGEIGRRHMLSSGEIYNTDAYTNAVQAGVFSGTQQEFDAQRNANIALQAMRAVAAAAPGSQAPAQAEITIKLENAPRGTRITTDPKSTADVDLNVGYQMAGAQ